MSSLGHGANPDLIPPPIQLIIASHDFGTFRMGSQRHYSLQNGRGGRTGTAEARLAQEKESEPLTIQDVIPTSPAEGCGVIGQRRTSCVRFPTVRISRCR